VSIDNLLNKPNVPVFPVYEGDEEPTPLEVLDKVGPKLIAGAFHIAAYNAAQEGRSWGGATYMGVKTWKWPCDLHLYAELVWELKPRLIIETGTAFGGSALYFAHLLDAIGVGKVVSVDLKPVENSYPRHPRIAYFGGESSVSPNILREVEGYFASAGCRPLYWKPTPPKMEGGGSGNPCLVVLDSDHSKVHVLQELEHYSRFVPPGSWLVVEDTNINGHPVYPEFGPGPQEALDEWLPKHPDFKVDEKRAVKFLWSMHTWIRRQRV